MRLRPWQLSDVPNLVEICRDVEISRWTPVPSPYGAEHARELIEAAEHGHDTGTAALFAIAGRAGELLGSMVLVSISDEGRRAEVGYWIARAHRNQGIATAALRCLTTWAFGEYPNMRRIELLTLPYLES
jgi:RimJ/RimL family protein N-acetyltransferase